MSKTQARGLSEVLAEAEALARVLRVMSDGRLDLRPITRTPATGLPALNLSWAQAQTEAAVISRTETPRTPQPPSTHDAEGWPQ